MGLNILPIIVGLLGLPTKLSGLIDRVRRAFSPDREGIGRRGVLGRGTTSSFLREMLGVVSAGVLGIGDFDSLRVVVHS